MKNYTKTSIGNEGRVELHDALGLTGAEVSINALPAGAGVPFVHSHKENEEIYGILSGHGKAIIDGEEITLAAGDWLRIAPAAKRQFFAANDAGIVYVCVQVNANSPLAASRQRTLWYIDAMPRKNKNAGHYGIVWYYISRKKDGAESL